MPYLSTKPLISAPKNLTYPFHFFKNFRKKHPKKGLPIDLQIKMLSGDFDTKKVKEIISGYDLSEEELNIIANGFRLKKEFDLAEKYYQDALKKNKGDGDVYGNLISLYCEQEKYDLCGKTFKLGVKMAWQGREFIYFHQARAWFNQKKYDFAVSTAILGIEKEEKYEPLFILCIKSWIIMGAESHKQNKSEEAKDTFALAGKMAHIAHSIFPESEEVSELYDLLFEEKK